MCKVIMHEFLVEDSEAIVKLKQEYLWLFSSIYRGLDICKKREGHVRVVGAY